MAQRESRVSAPPEARSARSRVRPVATPVGANRPQRDVLALQRTLGNRAVASLLAQQRSSRSAGRIDVSKAPGGDRPASAGVLDGEQDEEESSEKGRSSLSAAKLLLWNWRRQQTAPGAGGGLTGGAQLPAQQAAQQPQQPAPQQAQPAPRVTASGTLTPVDDFPGRSQTRFGVGEKITLSATTNGGTMAQMGGLRWRKSSGQGQLRRNKTRGTGTFTCSDQAGPVTLKLVVAEGDRAGEVVDTKTIQVVKPSAGVMTRVPGTGIDHTHGTADAGFLGDMWIHPIDVSFSGISQREGSGTGTGTGSMASGTGEVHDPSAADKVVSAPDGSGQGSRVNQVDTVHSEQLHPPFSAGTFDWPIAWEWRIGSGAYQSYETAVHSERVDDQGAMTISKAGSPPVTTQANDPDSTY